MDEFVFEPHIRGKIKRAIIGVFMEEGHQHDTAAEAGEMFVRLIETGISRMEASERRDGDRDPKLIPCVLR